MMHEQPRGAVVGWIMAAGGALVAAVEDMTTGLSVSGIIAGMIALSGGAYVAYGNLSKLIEKRQEDRRTARRKDAESELEIETIRRQTKARWEEEARSTLSGQLEKLNARLEEQAAEHRHDAELAERHQAELKATLELAERRAQSLHDDLARLRASNHEIRNQITPIMAERDLLKIQLDEANARLASISATGGRLEAKADRIEAKVGRIADSTDELPTRLAPPPPSEG